MATDRLRFPGIRKQSIFAEFRMAGFLKGSCGTLGFRTIQQLSKTMFPWAMTKSLVGWMDCNL